MSSKALYDIIGGGYNVTRQADRYIAGRLYQFLSPQSEGLYLDLGCGTGNYTIAIAEKVLHFYGVEPSEQIARKRSDQVIWLEGTAEQIPAKDNSFHGAIATLTVHHWKDLNKAFGELYRVLKPGARLVIFTATPEQMQGYWLNYYFPVMMENSILQMPSYYTISNAMSNSGFNITGTEPYFIADDLKDNFLYVGKNRPELYFEEDIRRGISSFSTLANVAEVARGLERLHADIAGNRFEAARAMFENDKGDYLFIIAEKC
jgi:SAM-dependent methyltransferase